MCSIELLNALCPGPNWLTWILQCGPASQTSFSTHSFLVSYLSFLSSFILTVTLRNLQLIQEDKTSMHGFWYDDDKFNVLKCELIYHWCIVRPSILDQASTEQNQPFRSLYPSFLYWQENTAIAIKLLADESYRTIVMYCEPLVDN